MIQGVILAAGRSQRMGRSKPLLPYPATGGTFVTRLVTVLRGGGVPDVLIVLRPDDTPLRTEVASVDPPPRVVINPDADRGQLSSLQCALDAVERAGCAAGGLLVMPVDMPFVRPETIARVTAAFERGAAPIARAVYRGRHGHPVVFAPAVFEHLRRADAAVGARAVLRTFAGAVLDVDVDDAGVLQDIDDAAAYRAAFGADPE